MRSGDGLEKEERSILEEGFGTFNEFLLHLTPSPAAFPVRRKKMKRKTPHTVAVGEVLGGQSITNQSLKVLLLLVEDVLHYLQIFNGETCAC